MYFLIPPQSQTPARTSSRQGIALLVVVSMLALFAIVGVGFVIYAQSEATSSRYTRESKGLTHPDVEPELAFHYFMNQLLYDVPADASGVLSSMRGHAMGTNMHGYNKTGLNTSPYSGMGRLHFQHAAGTPIFGGLDDFHHINYQWFALDGILRDPEYSATRANPNTPLDPTKYIGGYNPSYTYPDLNTMFVAGVNAKGEILKQSFFREIGYDPADPTKMVTLDPSNPIWATDISTLPNWQRIKYLTVRPLPSYNTVPGKSSFSKPADGGGDVANRPPHWKGVPIPGQPGKYYNNDSIWMDLGFPVMTGPNGTKYKILFAPLIVCLDSKINLNAHGNLNNGSLQGWGPWELSLAKALAKDPNEWKNILNSRYGPDGKPKTSGGAAGGGRAPFTYAQVDFDGITGPSYLMPGSAGGPVSFVPFPAFPAARFGNGNAAERLDHAAQYNPFLPQGDDLAFHASHLEGLYRYGDTNSPALSSLLYKIAPINFSDPFTRLLVTTHSADLNFPGAPPWLYTQDTNPVAPYQLVPGQPFPTGQPLGSPSWLLTPQNSGEFAGSLRSLTAALGKRLNLNRDLPDYPYDSTVYKFDPATGYMDLTDQVTHDAFHAADDARKVLAKEIFDRLVLVTTGLRPKDAGWPVKGNAADKGRYDALRSLAQLAVNMVDYRDEDDIATVLQWNKADEPTEIVVGTELPRVVLNEVYSEISNNPADIGGATATLPYNVNFWVELHNPFQNPNRVDGTDDGTARLQVVDAAKGVNYSPYKLEIYQTPVNNIGNLDNVLGEGEPNPANPNLPPSPAPANLKLEVKDFNPPAGFVPPGGVDTKLIKPSPAANLYNANKTNPANEGFYVVGPTANFPPTGQVQPTLKVAEVPPPAGTAGPGTGLSYTLPNTTVLPLTFKHTVLLRRLACPCLPPQPNPALDDYNPYITVDYMEDVLPEQAVVVDSVGAVVATDIVARKSWGRKQTYTARKVTQVVQQAPSPPNAAEPQHTFFRQNGQGATGPLMDATTNEPIDQTLDLPFDWLVHLDRQLISPVELLHVSAFPPHLLTQQFKDGPSKFGHLAPWFNENARIYRLLEFVECGSRISGLTGSRIPGKINLNMVFDEEIFQALCDAQGLPYTPDEVKTIFQAMMQKRTPSGIPGPNDSPFKSLATGVVPAGDPHQPKSGIQDTFLCANPADPAFAADPKSAQRLFGIAGPDPTKPLTHPYQKMELMTKIFNNITTRSNVFAVWVTVGFFEVTDEYAIPPKLGAEIGFAEGRHVRYRMFSIVDRTQLAALRPNWATVAEPPIATGPSTVKVSDVNIKINPHTLPAPTAGYSFTLQPGMTLRFDPGNAREETVIIHTVDATAGNASFTAYFNKPHPVGAVVSVVGPDLSGNLNGGMLAHPGPDPQGYRPFYNAPILHYSIIEGK